MKKCQHQIWNSSQILSNVVFVYCDDEDNLRLFLYRGNASEDTQKLFTRLKNFYKYLLSLVFTNPFYLRLWIALKIVIPELKQLQRWS